MAFFKFRWPGQGEQAQAEKPSKRPRTPQAESIEVMRRRARHRLIGAAVLVLIGVIGFPMLFDTQPRPIPVDIPIEIPDRNKVAPLVVPAPVAEAPAAAKPSTPSSQDVATAPRPTPQRNNSAVGNGLSCRETRRRDWRCHLRRNPHPWRRGAGEVESSGSSLEWRLDRSR